MGGMEDAATANLFRALLCGSIEGRSYRQFFRSPFCVGGLKDAAFANFVQSPFVLVGWKTQLSPIFSERSLCGWRGLKHAAIANLFRAPLCEWIEGHS